MGSIELRHAPFAGFMTCPHRTRTTFCRSDGRNDVLHSKMSPTTVTDPMQQKDRGLYAGHLYGVLPVVPVGSGAVLYRQRHFGHHHSTGN